MVRQLVDTDGLSVCEDISKNSTLLLKVGVAGVRPTAVRPSVRPHGRLSLTPSPPASLIPSLRRHDVSAPLTRLAFPLHTLSWTRRWRPKSTSRSSRSSCRRSTRK